MTEAATMTAAPARGVGFEPVLLAIAAAAVDALSAVGAHEPPEDARGRLVGPLDGGRPLRVAPHRRAAGQPSFHYLEPDKRAAAWASIAARAAALEAAQLGWRVAASTDAIATLKRLRGPEARLAILTVAASAAPFQQAADLAEALAEEARTRGGRRLTGLAIALDGRETGAAGAFARPDSPRRATALGLKRGASPSGLFEALGDTVATPYLGGPKLVLTAILATPPRV
jgi:hypothetical protein